MENEGSYVALGLKMWKTQIGRADKLFGSLSFEDVLREIAPGRNRLLYLWGHLTATHDAMRGSASFAFEILQLLVEQPANLPGVPGSDGSLETIPTLWR